MGGWGGLLLGVVVVVVVVVVRPHRPSPLRFGGACGRRGFGDLVRYVALSASHPNR